MAPVVTWLDVSQLRIFGNQELWQFSVLWHLENDLALDAALLRTRRPPVFVCHFCSEDHRLQREFKTCEISRRYVLKMLAVEKRFVIKIYMME